MAKHLFCFGLGYVAQALIAELSKDSEWKFSGTKRSDSHIHGVAVFNYDNLAILPRNITHILVSIPPKDEGDVVVKQFSKQIKMLPNLKWVGYLSATGVYGDTRGAWVDENSALNPGNVVSKKRLIAEHQWQDLSVPLNIFRLSGIYGQGRSAIEQVLSGTAKIIDKPEQYFSRIHVEDIIQVLIKTIEKEITNETYNLADDLPSNPREVIEYACELLKIAPPKPIKLEEAELSEMGKIFYSENKRVKNDKIKNQLSIKLKYPTYKEGLKAGI